MWDRRKYIHVGSRATSLLRSVPQRYPDTNTSKIELSRVKVRKSVARHGCRGPTRRAPSGSMDGPTGACAGWERLLRLSREIALSGTCGVEPANGLFGVELEVFVIDANSGLAVDKL